LKDPNIADVQYIGNLLPTTTPATTATTTTTSSTTAAAAAATTTTTAEEDTAHTQVDSNEATMPGVDDGGITSGNNELSSSMSTAVPENAPADEPTEGTTIHDAYQYVPGGVSRIHHKAPLIAAAGGLAAISLLVAGFYHMKSAKGGTRTASSIPAKSPSMASRLQATPWIRLALLRASNWVSEPSTLTSRVGLSYSLSLTDAISFCGYEPHLCGGFLSMLSVF
jgi:hypothetical protein